MKRKIVIISMIAGILIVGVCAKSAFDGREASVAKQEMPMEASVKENHVEEEPAEQEIEAENPEDEPVKEPEEQDKNIVPEKIHFGEPVVKRNGEEGELWCDWDSSIVKVDEETFLLESNCYFLDRTRQQKIFFLAKAPDYELLEVFRQNNKGEDEEPEPAKWAESRMRRLHTVEDGWIYEVDEVLYFLDRDFRGAEPVCDLAELLGELYSFSPDTGNSCDVTADASRLLACTYEGLYEYDLESGQKTLLEPAFFAHREIALTEEDCACGVRDFEFDGPVEAEYAPDEQSYVFLTGTEEADWGDINGAVLQSMEGKTLYRKDAQCVYKFWWVETQDKDYLMVSYDEDDRYWLDRVEISTGETETFETPFPIDWSSVFLDEDTLFGALSGGDKSNFEVYRLSAGEWQDLELEGEVDWKLYVMNEYDWYAYAIRYPQKSS